MTDPVTPPALAYHQAWTSLFRTTRAFSRRPPTSRLGPVFLRPYIAAPSNRESAMPTYLITNRVPDGFTPSPQAFAAWTAWFDSLGDAD